jgi:hypothetical protein
MRNILYTALLAIAVSAALPCEAAPDQQPAAQVNPAAWPRKIELSNASAIVYPPEINKWTDNQIEFHVAMAITPQGAKESFGSITGTARAQIDRDTRTAILDNLKITGSDFPLLPDHGAAYVAELQAQHGADIRTVSLDRLQASLAKAGIKLPPMPIKNDPPQVIVSYSPSILVPIEGAPVIKPVPEHSRFQRVINTHALILQGGIEQNYYIHVYDGWLKSNSLNGPWDQASDLPFGMERAAQEIEKTGMVDMLNGGPDISPKPSLSNGIPAIFTTQAPAELIVFTGQPDFVPITGTQLLWASNTRSQVFINTANSNYYVLLAGRWFSSSGLAGPWTFVPSNALPQDFAQIPANTPAGVVLQSVANTPQAQEAAIENAIPQTATVPRVNGPTFIPTFDGVPQYAQIPGTPLSYVVNSSVPLIKVDAHTYYAVSSGIWFTSTTLEGPWVVAASVPQVIYTIPPSSPLHYVTYVRIYEATPEVIYVGYTPGYMGTVVEPSGTVVYGTGYTYTPWVGDVYYPAPVTYTVAAAPVYDPAAGLTFGFAMGMLAASSSCCYGSENIYYSTNSYNSYYHGTATANTYGQFGNTAYSGTRTYSANGSTVSTTAKGNYDNKATGTTGTYNAQRNYNADTGVASQGYDRTANTAAGGTGNAARSETYNTNTGQYNTHSDVSGTTAGGSTVEHTGSSTVGPQGYGHTGETTVDNAKTGQTKSYGTGSEPKSGSSFGGGEGGRSWGGGEGGRSWGGGEGGRSWGGGGARSFGGRR